MKGVNPDGIITKNRVGFICDNTDEIQKKIFELLNNNSLFTKMSLKSIQMSNEKFDLKNYVDKFIDELCKI